MKITRTPSGRTIGDRDELYLIAEVGTTCAGSLDVAIELVQSAAGAGMDAVKFQLIDPYQDSDPNATYPVFQNGRLENVNMREMFKKLQFRRDDWSRIAKECRDQGVDFLSTVDYLGGVEILEALDVYAHKIGAWDSTYLPLAREIGETGKPLYLDLGPTTEKQIEEVVDVYLTAGGSTILFLHDFHTDIEDEMNFRAITYLKDKYGWPVGYSSPGLDHDLDFMALGLGADFIEKRLILDRAEQVFHSHQSLEPNELRSWVKNIRRVHRALGTSSISPSRKDIEDSVKYYRSICTSKPVKKGEVFSMSNITFKRPGTGLSAVEVDRVLGISARRDYLVDEIIFEDDVS